MVVGTSCSECFAIFPYQFHSNNAPYTFLHLSLTLNFRGIGVYKTRALAETTELCTMVLGMEPAS